MRNIGQIKQFFNGITVVGLFIIYLPIIGIIVSSFLIPNEVNNDILEFSFIGFIKAFQNEELVLSIMNSVFIAFCTSSITTLLALIMSYALQDQNIQLLHKWRSLFYLPLMLPEIVIGISLLLWFVFIHLTLGKSSLLLSHVSFTLPYAVVILTLGIEGMDPRLLEAAKDLGANSNKIFTLVTLPLLKPSLLGIFLLSFVISFDDFLISYFTAGAGNDTLPMKLYSLMRYGLSSELKAISTLILSLSLIVTFVLFKLSMKQNANSLQSNSEESLTQL